MGHYRRALLGIAAAMALVTLYAPRAWAHQSSLAYSELDIDAARQKVRYRVRLANTDLFEALELDSDRAATDAEIEAGSSKLYPYVQERVHLETKKAMKCSAETEPLGLEKSGAGSFAVLAWTWSCPEPIDELTLVYDLFFDLDPLHTSPLRARYQGEQASVILDDGENRFVWALGEPPPSGFVGFLYSGVEHILFGLDHILFLVSLLLVAVLRRDGKELALRGTRDGLRYALTIVTSFTIAHSVTLILAALGYIPIPARLVESIIALSIVYVAVENIFRPDPPRRYLVTFSFGLLHGMGFAAMLRELLPEEGLVVPVLSFNLGVELGQLLVVSVLLPLLFAAARVLGPERYRGRVLPIGGGLAALLGGLWLLERLFDLSLLPF
jgi:hydrogenase/urease accessory protein HupE